MTTLSFPFRRFRTKQCLSREETDDVLELARARQESGSIMVRNNAFATPRQPYSFMERAKTLVYEYIKTHVTVNDVYSRDDVVIVWFNKAEKDWAAVLTSTLQPNILYRVAHDAREKQTSIAVYNKFDIQTFADKEIY